MVEIQGVLCIYMCTYTYRRPGCKGKYVHTIYMHDVLYSTYNHPYRQHYVRTYVRTYVLCCAV